MLLLLYQVPSFNYSHASLSNTVKQIRPVNGLTRLVRPVQVVKQWFMSHTNGELHRYLHTDDKKFCRTHTTREWLETNMLRTMYVFRSEHVNAPKCKTWWIFFVLKAREPESSSYDMQFTNCTTRKPLFYDPYESYESWTCIYTLSLSNDTHFTNCTTCKPLFHDPYESYESWTCIYTESLTNDNDIHFTNCTTPKPLFHDQYNLYESNGSC